MNLEQKKKKIESLKALIPALRKHYPENYAKGLFKLKMLEKEIEDSELIKANKELVKSNYK